MPTIRIEETVDAAQEELFAVLSDHEGASRFPGVRKCELVRPGREERNGLGALRRVYLRGATVLDEEIVAYDPPNSYEYRVRRARPLPVRHTLGRIELEALGPSRTNVIWVSTFEVPLPIVGKAIAKRAVAQFSRAFRATIRTAASLAVKQAA